MVMKNSKPIKSIPTDAYPKVSLLEKVFLKTWRPYCWIVILGALVYSQTLFFDYTSLDDLHLIVYNAENLSNLRNIPTAFKTDVFWKSSGAYYRPLFVVSLMFDAAWGGIKPFVFHLSNVVLHISVAILIFIVLNSFGYKRHLSFLFSLVFTAHPALSQAVAWIPGRNDVLLTLFTLISFWSLLKIAESWSWTWALIHFSSLAAAFFTKETALIIPVIFLFFISVNCRGKVKTRLFATLAAGWVVIGAIYYLMRNQAIHSDLSNIAFNIFKENIAGLISYIGKVTIPINLSVLPVVTDIRLITGFAAIFGLGLLWLIKGVANKKMFWFGLIWFLFFLIPTIIRSQDFAVFMEQRLYLPLFGFIIMMLESGIMKYGKTGLILPIIIALFSFQTVRHSTAFATEISFWGNAAATSPSSYIAHRMMGKLRFLRGEAAEAEKEYKQALLLNPNDINANNELGTLFIKTGKIQQAEVLAVKVANLYPNHVGAQNNLGYFYLVNGMLRQAKQALNRGLLIDSCSAVLHLNLATLYIDEQKYDSACYHYDLAMQYGYEPSPQIEEVLKPYRSVRRK